MHRDDIDLGRLLNLSDGVFAVAMTFLAFTVQLPSASKAAKIPLVQQLDVLLPQLAAMAVSYFVIARFWLGHHRMFRFFRGGGRQLVVLNLMFLFCVVLLPFSTDILGDFMLQPLAVGLYAINIAAIGATEFFLLQHAVRVRLLTEEPVADDAVHLWLRRAGFYPVVFLISAPISWLSPRLAVLSWAPVLLFPLIQHHVRRGGAEKPVDRAP